MSKIFSILKPLLWLALCVGVVRFGLTILHAPRAVVYLASLTVVQLGGMIYLAFRIARERELGYLHLWTANLMLFGFCRLFDIIGLAYTYFSGTPTLYHEGERLRNFLGYEPTLLQHMWIHVLNWVIIAPVLATWVIGLPIMYFRRRKLNPTGRGGPARF